MEPEEVLSGKSGNTPSGPARTAVYLYTSKHNVMAMMLLLEQLTAKNLAPDTEVVFVLKTEESRTARITLSESRGMSEYFPSEPRRIITEAGHANLTQAISRAFSNLEAKAEPFLRVRETSLDQQVSCYGPTGKSASLLRRAARKPGRK